MARVLVAGRIHESGLALLRDAPDVVLDYVEEVSLESYRPLAESADAILIRTQPMPAAVIEAARNLKIVSRHGVGFDAVDVAALNRRGIPLAVVGDVNSRAVAEHAMALVLATTKRLPEYDAHLRAGDWNFRNELVAGELFGATLLIVGFGRIGQHVAAMAAPFGMRILAFDRYRHDDEIRAGGAEPVQRLEDGLRQADIVSLHIPRSDGRPVLGAEELAAMKRTAIIVNTARGGLIDEAALAQALNDGRLAAAGLDVFRDEPPKPDDPLLLSSHAIVTPHAAGLTEACAERMSVAAARNILDFFAGRLDPSLVVNASALSAGALQ
jgi:D-3-phosphoglycerate dehydrogenase